MEGCVRKREKSHRDDGSVGKKNHRPSVKKLMVR